MARRSMKYHVKNVSNTRLVKLYRKYGSVKAVVKHTTLSYMGVRYRLIEAGVVEGKLPTEY